MAITAFLISISIALSLAIFLPLIVSGKQARVAQEKARARRLTDAKMNARLLRLNL